MPRTPEPHDRPRILIAAQLEEFHLARVLCGERCYDRHEDAAWTAPPGGELHRGATALSMCSTSPRVACQVALSLAASRVGAMCRLPILPECAA